jgi:hypothetical protein
MRFRFGVLCCKTSLALRDVVETSRRFSSPSGYERFAFAGCFTVLDRRAACKAFAVTLLAS